MRELADSIEAQLRVAGTATVSSNTSLLRGLREGRATGTATVINAGKRFITVRTDVVDEDGRLHLPGGSGLGVDLDMDAVAELRRPGS